MYIICFQNVIFIIEYHTCIIIYTTGQNGGNMALLSQIIIVAYFHDLKTILFIL